jgi:hypothetical protein
LFLALFKVKRKLAQKSPIKNKKLRVVKKLVGRKKKTNIDGEAKKKRFQQTVRCSIGEDVKATSQGQGFRGWLWLCFPVGSIG